MNRQVFGCGAGYVEGGRNNLRGTILDGTKIQPLWRYPCIHTAGTMVINCRAASEAAVAPVRLDDVDPHAKHVACGAHDRAGYSNCARAFAEGGAGDSKLVIAACEDVEWKANASMAIAANEIFFI